MIDIKTTIFNALNNIVQPEIARWLDAFFTMKLGRYYWNDYIVHGYAKHISDKKWSSLYKSLRDVDISTLWEIVLYFKNNFNCSNDEIYGNLYNIKNALGILNELRDKTDHNSANNIKNLSVDDLYSIVHALNAINASEDSKHKIKKMIKEISGELSPTSNGSETFPTKEDEVIEIGTKKGDSGVKIVVPKTFNSEKLWDRYSARDFCCNHGCQIHKKYFNYSSENAVGDVYWINAGLDWVNHDWDIMLDYDEDRCFKILHIPANTFSANNFNIKYNKSGAKINLSIDKHSLIDKYSKIDFEPYLVKTIKY